MFELIEQISRILNTCKNFIAAHSSNRHDLMVIKYKDKLYKVHFEEVEAPQVTDKLRERYVNSNDEVIQLVELVKQ